MHIYSTDYKALFRGKTLKTHERERNKKECLAMYIVYSLFSKYIRKLIFNEISLVFFFFYIKRMTGFVSEETYISCYMYVYNFHFTRRHYQI